MHPAITWIKSHITLIITAAIAVPLIAYAYGCQSMTASLLDPDARVTRPELQAELQYLVSKAEARFADLDRQDDFKATLFDQFLVATQSGTVNPQGIIAAIIGALGIGALVNNVKLRYDLNGKKKASPNGPPVPPTTQ